jgi:hypothetical protein
VRDSLFAWLEVIPPALQGLVADHCAPVAFHRGVVCGDELRRDHALDFILRSNSDQPRDSCVVLPLAHFLIGMLDRERLKRLVAENLVPVVGLRSADAFQGLFPIIGNDRSGLNLQHRRRRFQCLRRLNCGYSSRRTSRVEESFELSDPHVDLVSGRAIYCSRTIRIRHCWAAHR